MQYCAYRNCTYKYLVLEILNASFGISVYYKNTAACVAHSTRCAVEQNTNWFWFFSYLSSVLNVFGFFEVERHNFACKFFKMFNLCLFGDIFPFFLSFFQYLQQGVKALTVKSHWVNTGIIHDKARADGPATASPPSCCHTTYGMGCFQW